MITAIVNFKLPADLSAAQVAELYKASTPKYRAATGLVRKYYLHDPATRTGGGVYLWHSRSEAEAFYSAEWRKAIAERFGAPPEIRFFDTPVIVDNDMPGIPESLPAA